MMNFIRSVCITISSAFFTLIPTLYSLFHGMAAEPTMFNTEEINNLTNNIYTLVSVVMLFAFATRAISAIVNPDNLWDSKKGVTSVIKRSLIALVLLVTIPFAFEYFYVFQTKVINNNLIEKVILGLDFSKTTLTEEQQEQLETYLNDDSIDDETKDQIKKIYKRSSASYWIGQSLAQNTLKAVLYPNPSTDSGNSSTTTSTDSNSSNEVQCVEGGGVTFSHPIKTAIKIIGFVNPAWFANDIKNYVKNGNVQLLNGIVTYNNSDSLCENYNLAISDNIEYVKAIVPSINNTTGTFISTSNEKQAEHYVLEFTYWGILGVVVSGVVVYMLLLFCIDSAVRLIKMAFLQITAPISIMAYVYSGNDILKKWFKEVLATAISFFLRVAAIGFLALVLMHLDNFGDNLPVYYNREAKLLVIIGSLIFAKQVPETIERMLGVRMNLQGGLTGRLAKMAVVGSIAKNALDTLRNKTKGAIATVGGFGLGAAIGAGKLGAKKIDNKAFNGEGLEKLKDTKAVKTLTAAGKVAKAGISQNGKIGSTMKAMEGEWNKTALAGDIKSSADLEQREAKRQAAIAKNRAMGFNDDGSTIKGKGKVGKDTLMSTIRENKAFNGDNKNILDRFATISEATAELADASKGQSDTLNLVNSIRERRLAARDESSANEASKLLKYTQQGRYDEALAQAKNLKDKGIIDNSEYNKFMASIKSQEKGLNALDTIMKVNPELGELNGNEAIKALLTPNANGLYTLNATSFGNAIDAMNGNTDKHITGVLKTLEDTIKNMAPEGSRKAKQAEEYVDAVYRHNTQIVRDNKEGDFGGRYASVDLLETSNAGPKPMTGFVIDGQSAPDTSWNSGVMGPVNQMTSHYTQNNQTNNTQNVQTTPSQTQTPTPNINNNTQTQPQQQGGIPSGGTTIKVDNLEAGNISASNGQFNGEINKGNVDTGNNSADAKLESAINKMVQGQQQMVEETRKAKEQAAADAKREERILKQNTQAQKEATEELKDAPKKPQNDDNE